MRRETHQIIVPGNAKSIPFQLIFYVLLISTLSIRAGQGRNSSHTQNQIVAAFINPNGTNEHLAVHKISGFVYLSQTNRIVQLGPNLKSVGSLVFGPVQDNKKCYGNRNIICPENSEPDNNGDWTDNYNKILLIDYENDKLIFCNSAFQGLCTISGLNNLSPRTETRIVSRPIVANDQKSSSFGFIGPGPPSPGDVHVEANSGANVLYVATSYTGNPSEYRRNVPSVSSRILSNPEFILDYAGADYLNGESEFSGSNFNANLNTNVNPNGRPQISVRAREEFPVKYVYGFSSDGFSYFLSIQKTDYRRSSVFISKLIRICQNDPDYKSYAEIPIECIHREKNRKFRLVQAAFLGRAGKKLKKHLDLNSNSDPDPEEGDVLFASFSTAYPYGSPNPANDSALCVFPMREIRRKFQENIKNCFAGQGMRGLGFIKPDAKCIGDSTEIPEDFCGSTLNSPFGGEMPISPFSLANFDSTRVTAIAVKIVGDYTVGFLGTNKGRIKKVILGNPKETRIYDTLTIDEGQEIKPDLVFDPAETHLYVLTSGKVTKISLHGRCSRMWHCDDCTQLGDPFCGWCKLKSRCTSAGSCVAPSPSQFPSSSRKEMGFSESPWISMENPDRCPAESLHCPDLADNCLDCTLLDRKLDCGWCVGSSSCLRMQHCSSDFSWLSPGKGEECSASPEILSFEPTSGPIEGGTNVTINLLNFEQVLTRNVYLRITIAGVQCMVQNPRSSFSGRVSDPVLVGQISCAIRKRLQSNIPPNSLSGPISIQTPELRFQSKENFTFVHWKLVQIFPTVGPIRGGTHLTIFGENLNVGREASAFVGETPCYITKRENETVHCATQSFYESGTFGVSMRIDGTEKGLPLVFSYVKNPVILRTKQSVVHGSLRGGSHVTAEGYHLDGVQDAYFVVSLNDTDFMGVCNVTTAETLQCLTPVIDEDPENLLADWKESKRDSEGGETKSDSSDEPESEHEDEDPVLLLQYKFLLDTVDTYIANLSADRHVFVLQLSSPHVHEIPGADQSSSATLFAVLFSIALILLILAILGFFLYRRRKNRKFAKGNQKNVLTMTELQEFQNGKPKFVEKGVLPNENPYIIPYNTKFEVPERRFTMDAEEILGNGAFGVVTRGTVDGVPVAVKTLKADAQKMHLTALMSELKILIHLGSSGRHPNIVNLVGANTRHINQGRLYMFVELCPLGSLDKYLRSHRSKFHNQIDGDDQIDVDSMPEHYENSTVAARKELLRTVDLLNFSLQVASGMEYLAHKHIIHADLATRNLLLRDKKTVKITDFGLARKLYDYTNYVKKHQEPLPWRWMSVESLRDLSFSSQSDVWSFGITLFEIFTLGDLPYPGLSWTIDFADKLQHGLQNTKPKFATSDIYNTMRECWKLEPEDRPSFTHIRKYFNAVLNDCSPQTGDGGSIRKESDEKDVEGYLVPLLPHKK